ncbi:PKD domain-containing protein [Actinoplanes subglobosus]|uniref:PKD domain-containing protein n=1 Tax=Actinoplanes subglobosus TaxID=1547892 RepID=A0ABV8IU82_9ACTN
MKSRFTLPVVAAVVGGTMLAGSPAHAIPGAPDAPTGKNPQTVTEQSATTLDTVDPGTGTTDPGTGTTDPGTGTTDPGTGTTDPGTGTADPDTTAPTGSFRISWTSVWTGQAVTVVQDAGEFSDPVDAQSTLSRVVNWGDGTSTVLSPTTFTATKAYSKAGNFQVTVTVTDPAGNNSAIPPRTVAVTAPAGGISLNKKSVYQGAPFNIKITKVPAGAKTYRIDWSDGSVSTHSVATRALNGAYLHYYWKWDAAKKKWVRNGTGRITGVRALKVAWGNDKGYSTFQTGASINVVKDGWKPTVSIKKPSPSNKASAWKTIRGTATDKGSGLRHVGVTVFRVTSTGKAYCLTPQKKWKRYYTDADVNKYCYATGYKVKVVNGKWSLKLPAGIARNQFVAAEIWAYDRADNYRTTYRTGKLTRS